jgi:hypothetical protein
MHRHLWGKWPALATGNCCPHIDTRDYFLLYISIKINFGTLHHEISEMQNFMPDTAIFETM